MKQFNAILYFAVVIVNVNYTLNHFQEADSATMVALMDLLISDDLKVGRIQADIVGRMCTFKKRGAVIKLSVFDCVDNISGVNYVVLFIFVLVITTLMVMAILLHDQRKLMMKHAFDSLSDVIWNIFNTLVNQESYEPRWHSIRLVWLAWCFGIFVIVFGLLINLISTDLVVQKQGRTLDSLQELLYDPEYSEHRLFILKQLYIYGVLKQAKQGSDLNKLFNRIHLKENEEYLGSLNDRARLMQTFDLYDRALYGDDKMVTIADKTHYDHFIKLIFCSIRPDFIEHGHWSEEMFAKGLGVNFFNKHVNPIAFKLAIYRQNTLLEMHMMKPIFIDLRDAFIQEVNSVSAAKISYCENYDFYKQGNEADMFVHPFSLNGLRPAFKLLVIGLLASCLLCCLEWLIDKCVNFCKRRKIERSMSF